MRTRLDWMPRSLSDHQRLLPGIKAEDGLQAPGFRAGAMFELLCFDSGAKVTAEVIRDPKNEEERERVGAGPRCSSEGERKAGP